MESDLPLREPRDVQMTFVSELRARGDLVGGDHARPRLNECRLGKTGLLLDGKKVAALVPFEDLGPDDHELGEPAGALPFIEDIGLDDVAAAQLEFPFPFIAHSDDGHGHLVAGNGRVLREVAAFDTRMRAPR